MEKLATSTVMVGQGKNCYAVILHLKFMLEQKSYAWHQSQHSQPHPKGSQSTKNHLHGAQQPPQAQLGLLCICQDLPQQMHKQA